MLKTILVTAVGAGALGTGAQTLSPQAIELTTGPVKITAASDGITTAVADTAGLAITIKTKSGRNIRLSL